MTDEQQDQATEPVQTPSDSSGQDPQALDVQGGEPAAPPASPPPGTPQEQPPTAQAIHVDGRNRRNADDGLEGGFVRVKSGEHQGRVGVFLRTLEHAKDGYPERILFRSRDAENELLDVAYSDVEDAGAYRGGR